MFEYAEDHQVKKTYSKCETRQKHSLVLQNNYTICSHCNDPLYQLASVRDSGDEDKCGKHAIVGEVDLNDCCVRINIEKRDNKFDLIFGFFIVIFLIVFACLYMCIEAEESAELSAILSTGKSTEVSESSQPLVQPPVPPVTVFGYPTAPPYMGGVPMTYGSKP